MLLLVQSSLNTGTCYLPPLSHNHGPAMSSGKPRAVLVDRTLNDEYDAIITFYTTPYCTPCPYVHTVHSRDKVQPSAVVHSSLFFVNARIPEILYFSDNQHRADPVALTKVLF
jgi:hypothetical protein